MLFICVEFCVELFNWADDVRGPPKGLPFVSEIEIVHQTSNGQTIGYGGSRFGAVTTMPVDAEAGHL